MYMYMYIDIMEPQSHASTVYIHVNVHVYAASPIVAYALAPSVSLGCRLALQGERSEGSRAERRIETGTQTELPAKTQELTW